jgi:hypothetical protein
MFAFHWGLGVATLGAFLLIKRSEYIAKMLMWKFTIFVVKLCHDCRGNECIGTV